MKTTEKVTFGKTFNRIIATKERSAGNDTIGEMWIETKSFDRYTPVNEIMDWAEICNGKLYLTWDEGSDIVDL